MLREETQRLISELPYDSIQEMVPPLMTIKTIPPGDSSSNSDFIHCYPNAPYFNASQYCSSMGLRFSSWLRNPATVELFRVIRNYYREAAREKSPFLVMIVQGGRREVHGYYLHISLYDALSRWCEHEKLPPEQQRQIPVF